MLNRCDYVVKFNLTPAFLESFIACCVVPLGRNGFFREKKIGVSPKWYHTGGPAPLHTYVPRGGVSLDFVDRLHTVRMSGYHAPPLPFLLYSSPPRLMLVIPGFQFTFSCFYFLNLKRKNNNSSLRYLTVFL